MSKTTRPRRFGALANPRRLGAMGAAVLGAGLLLAACNNQYPAPPPEPGKPLTWAQKHQQDMERYQEWTRDRINN
jgi:outer membrane biogenesis lipoprotein LolB